MRTHLCLCFLFLAALLTASGCGGGSSGTSVTSPTVADLDGNWFGPTGVTNTAGTSIGPGTGGMLADAGGTVMKFWKDGVDTGVTGTVTPYSSPPGVFSVARSDGQTGMLMLSRDRHHLLYVDSAMTFGAWEKNATMLSSPYGLPDIENKAWEGLTAVIGPAPLYEPQSDTELVANTGTGGSFTENLLGSGGVSMTNTAPLATLEDTNGVFGGDFSTNGVPPATGQGPVLMLLTPDKQFLAVQFCSGGAWPEDCRYSTWQMGIIGLSD